MINEGKDSMQYLSLVHSELKDRSLTENTSRYSSCCCAEPLHNFPGMLTASVCGIPKVPDMGGVRGLTKIRWSLVGPKCGCQRFSES